MDSFSWEQEPAMGKRLGACEVHRWGELIPNYRGQFFTYCLECSYLQWWGDRYYQTPIDFPLVTKRGQDLYNKAWKWNH